MYQWVAADTLTSTRLKQTGQHVHAFTAAVAINASTSPIAVYFNSSGQAAIGDSSASSTAVLHGFVADAQNVAAAASVYVRTGGTVTGFTGLTAGTFYYLSTSGAISSTVGTVALLIGVATSTTELFILPSGRFKTGQTSRTSAAGTGTQSIVHGLGAIPKLVVIHYFSAPAGSAEKCTGVGTATSTTDETSSWSVDIDSAADTAGQTSGQIVHTQNSSGTTQNEASLTTLDSTNITLTWGTAAGSNTVYMQWEAYS